jgi:tetratricopeptide (TPR) repeat protein/DNA-binding CsgD family transcriptional regulator
MAEAYLSAGAIGSQRGEISKAFGYLEHAERLFGERDNRVGVARVFFARSTIYRQQGDLPEALRLLLEAEAIIREHGRDHQRAFVLNAQGIIYSRLGDGVVALERLNSALAIFTAENDRFQQSIVHQNIGKVYGAAGDLDEAERHFLLSHELRVGSGYTGGDIFEQINFGILMSDRGRPRDSLGHFESALELARTLRDPLHMTLSLMNMGIAHARLGDYRRAQGYLAEALDTCTPIPDRFHRAQILYNIAFCLLESGDTDGAMAPLTEALDILSETGEHDDLLAVVHNALSHAYERLADAPEALRHARLYEELRSRRKDNSSSLALSHVTMRLKIEQIEREQESIRIANERLREEMATKERELVTLAIHLAQKSELIRRLRQTIGSKKQKPPEEMAKLVESIAHELESEDGTEKIWERFEKRFHQIHPEFTGMLARRFPALSPAELRLCALLRLDLSTKEMAALLSLSPRSIEVYRSRIRSKLGLEGNASLVGFLCGL